MVQEQESTWIVQAQQGDPGAFAILVETYQRPVYNLCYRMLGNAQDAEDAAQETFLKAYKSMHKYDNERPFPTWILSIAAHHCIDQIRRRRLPLVSIEELPVPDVPEKSPDMEMKLSDKEDRSRIRALLAVLDPTDRALVVMYYWYDFSYDEIGQALNLTESAVKSRLHRARRAMAQRWLENQPAPGMAAERMPA
jgi:RNA polymerase sigma-70 factor, ECF subfamily